MSDDFGFEKLGIDGIVIDEAHLFKNFKVSGTLNKIRGSVGGKPKEFIGMKTADSDESNRVADIVRSVRNLGGRIVLASGTPTPNSAAELYGIQSLLDPESLRTTGIDNFDDWWRSYVETAMRIIVDNLGQTFENRGKVVDFVNAHIMYGSAYQVVDPARVTDVVDKAGNQLIPGRKPVAIVPVNLDAWQEGNQGKLWGEADRNPGNTMSVMTRLISNAVDGRFLDPNAPYNPNGKFALAAKKAKEILDETSHFNGVVAIFQDQQKSQNNRKFNAHQELRRILISLGVPQDQIVIAGEVSNEDIYATYQKLNAGELRVLIGSTGQGGTGVNFQQRLAAILHTDLKWNAEAFLQRNGRGYRPGNMITREYGYKLQIVNFVTQRTIEAYMVELTSQKSDSQELLVSGRGDTFVRASSGENEMETFPSAELQRVTIGDEFVMEWIRLQDKQGRLKNHLNSFKAGEQARIQKAKQAERKQSRLIAEAGQTAGGIVLLENISSISFDFPDSSPQEGAPGDKQLNAQWDKDFKKFSDQWLKEASSNKGIVKAVEVARLKTSSDEVIVVLRPDAGRTADNTIKKTLTIYYLNNLIYLNLSGSWPERLKAAEEKLRKKWKTHKEESMALSAAIGEGKTGKREWKYAGLLDEIGGRILELEAHVKNRSESRKKPQESDVLQRAEAALKSSTLYDAVEIRFNLLPIKDIISKAQRYLEEIGLYDPSYVHVRLAVRKLGEDAGVSAADMEPVNDVFYPGYFTEWKPREETFDNYSYWKDYEKRAIDSLRDEGHEVSEKTIHNAFSVEANRDEVSKMDIDLMLRERRFERITSGVKLEADWREWEKRAVEELRSTEPSLANSNQEIEDQMTQLAESEDMPETVIQDMLLARSWFKIKSGKVAANATDKLNQLLEKDGKEEPTLYIDPNGLGSTVDPHVPPETAAELMAHAIDILNRIAPGVQVDFAAEMEAGVLGRFVRGKEGTAQRGIVQILLAARNKIPRLIRHEAVHALRHMGLFTTDEWGLTKRFVDRNALFERYGIAERYPQFFDEAGKPDEWAYEEAFAEAFADWSERGDRPFIGFAIRLFRRLRRFLYRLLKRLGEVGGDLGESVSNLFQDIEQGLVGGRPVEADKRPAERFEPGVKPPPAMDLRVAAPIPTESENLRGKQTPELNAHEKKILAAAQKVIDRIVPGTPVHAVKPDARSVVIDRVDDDQTGWDEVRLEKELRSSVQGVAAHYILPSRIGQDPHTHNGLVQIMLQAYGTEDMGMGGRRKALKKVRGAAQHEAIHVLRALGLIRAEEWDILKKVAEQEKWFDRYQLRRFYDRLFIDGGPPKNEIAWEEAVAFAFDEYATKGKFPTRERIKKAKKSAADRERERAEQAFYKPSAYVKMRRLAWRILARIREFFKELRATLDRRTAERYFKSIDLGKFGLRDRDLSHSGANARMPRAGRPANAATVEPIRYRKEVDEPIHTYKNPETEAAYQKTRKGVRGNTSLLERIKEAGVHEWHAMSRLFIDLPEDARFAQAREWLRQLMSAPNVAAREIVDHLKKLTAGLSDAELDFMSRAIFLADFADDVAAGRQIPMFATVEEFNSELAAVRSKLAQPENRHIVRRILMRKAAINKIAREMVGFGLISEEALKNKNYITHWIWDYALEEAALAAAPGSKIKTPKWAPRKGSRMLINQNLIEAEAHWMQKALVDIETARMIENLSKSKYNVREALREAVTAHNRQASEAKMDADWRRLSPETYEEGRDWLKKGMAHTTLEVYKLITSGKMYITPPSVPYIDQLLAFQMGIGINRSVLRGGLKAAIQDNLVTIPGELSEAAEAFLASDEEAVNMDAPPQGKDDFWSLLAWLSALGEGRTQNESEEDPLFEIAGRAASILGIVAARRRFQKEQLGEKWIERRDMRKALKLLKQSGGGEEFDGYADWQPDPGRLFYSVTSLPDKLAAVIADRADEISEMVQETIPSAGPDDKKLIMEVATSLRSAITLGGPKYQMILPVELVKTIARFRDDHLLQQRQALFSAITRAWKALVLISPQQVIKYNIRNMSGDFDRVFGAFGAKPFRHGHPGKALRELVGVYREKQEPSAEYRDALRSGVIDSGWSIAEVASRKIDLARLVRPPQEISLQTLKNWYAAAGELTGLRENWLRYTVYLFLRSEAASAGVDLYGKIDAGARSKMLNKISFGGANRQIAMGLESGADLTAYLARETLGDYLAINERGRFLRSTYAPFWSWSEITLKFYWRLGKNIGSKFRYGDHVATEMSRAFSAAAAQSAVAIILQMLAFSVFLKLINYLTGEDDDELLRRDGRRPFYLKLGRVGDEIITIPAPGSLSEVLLWFGLREAGAAALALGKGEGSLGDILDAVWNGFANSIWQKITPFVKIPLETFSGISTWPDVMAPRMIRDYRYYWLNQLKIDKMTDAVAPLMNFGRPSRGPLNVLSSLVVDRYPAEYAAYEKIRSMGYTWKENLPGHSPVLRLKMSKHAQTLWYYKVARKFGDQKAAKRYYEAAKELGVTRAQMLALKRQQHPLAMLTVSEQRRFLVTLNARERKIYALAQKYWRETF